MIKILHAGDIHLDAPFSGLGVRESEIRKNELRAAFTSLMMYVRTSDIDVLLIPGDLFDSGYATRETVALIRREFENAPNCRIIISPGNHDPYSENSVYAKTAFSDNVYIFNSEKLSAFRFDDIGLTVYGYAFCSKELPRSPIAGCSIDPSIPGCSVLCAHADLRSPLSVDAPITVHDLAAFGCDYAALGHVHNAPDPARAGDTLYAYSGCLVGRGFDETGIKGAMLVELDENGAHAKRLRFSKKTYEIYKVGVDGASTMDDVCAAVTDAVPEKNRGEDTLLRLILTGAVSPSLVISKDAICARFSRLFHLDLRDETSPTWDADMLRNDPTIRGEFYRRLEPELTSEDPDRRALAANALRAGLAALSGENIV